MNQASTAVVDLSVVAAPRLTKWVKEPTLMELRQDYQDAKTSHDEQCSKIQEWLNNLNVEGKAKIKSGTGGSQIVPKLIRKQAEWRYASLSEPFLSTDELFNVKPATWEDREAAQQNQLLLNHQFINQVDRVKFIDDYVRAAVDEGTVIVRLGWKFEEEEVEEDVPQVTYQISADPRIAQLHEELAQMKTESPSQYLSVPEHLREAHDLTLEQGVPIEAIVTGWTKEKRIKTVCNRPTLEVCNYRNVVLDPTAKGDIDKANFLVYRFEASLSDLKKDGRYKNLQHINLGTNSILNVADHEVGKDVQNFNFADDARKKFVVHEYWGYRDIDGSGKVQPIVAAWVGETLIRLEANPFPDKKIPFVIEQYLPVRQANYGEPDGALLEDNQKVAGAVTRGMIDIMAKSANGQTGMRKDMLDITNRRKFEKGLDYEFNAGVDPRQGVYMHTYPEIPVSAQFMLQLQNTEAESMTGVKSFSQGVSGQSLGDVAAGIRGALDAASKRELGILRRLSNGIVKVGRKMISMNGEFLSEEEVIRITNEEFVQIKREDLVGNFDLRLSISTAEEDNNKAEQLAFMFQTVGPNGDAELNKMILSDIARLRKMPDLAKKIEAYTPQPDPLTVQKAELEIQLLQMQIAREQAEIQKLQSGSQLDVAKVGTEQAKANNLNSNTDQQNLDFVEQESGVKQERDLQKVGEQARSQAQLKVLDHNFKREEKKFDLVKEYVKQSKK